MDAHHWADTLASALGLIAFAALLVEFLFSGRQRWISGRIGVARTMRVHRRLAYAVIAIIIIHPFLYSAPDGVSWPWFNAADATLSLNGWSLYSGLGAWILTAAIILTAVDRDRLPWSYETWRILHVVSAIVLGALIAVHAITAGGFSSRLPLAIYWGLLLLAAGFTLIELFLLRPWRQRRHPYIVRTVDKVADRVWTLQVQPEGPDSGQDRMRFRPGQFAWLKFGPRAFRAREHPFSISTSPVDPSTIGFMIKEKGDFTDRIGDILPGSRVYLDGPYGHLLADDQPVPTVYIGAGTGISPILSHLRTFCSDQDPRKLTLVYSVSNDTVIPGKSEIDGMTRLLDLTVHYVVRHPSTRWRGATGTLDRPLLEACIPAQDRDHQRYFVCGPRRMEKRVAVALRQLKIPANRIVTGS
ncbi:MAG: hypothetical protein GVY11_08475 [Gammaproteobacteria bacterium]|jgi:predicted ferric reductase|nr:hypothetical protein [Gammaproteobacteria bacterium]